MKSCVIIKNQMIQLYENLTRYGSDIAVSHDHTVGRLTDKRQLRPHGMIVSTAPLNSLADFESRITN